MAVVELQGSAVEYEFERRGSTVAVILHGGHQSASAEYGCEPFRAADMSVLRVSRPGYGATAVSAGSVPAGFAARVADLIRSLGFESACAVGISAGGRAAALLAANHPDLVGSVVFESAVSFEPWPAAMTRRLGGLVFQPKVEWAVWGLTAALFRLAPTLSLLAMLAPLSLLPARSVLARLSGDDRRRLVDLFSTMRSGSGFSMDLRDDSPAPVAIAQPMLVIRSRFDRAVGPEHVEALRRLGPQAEVVESDALSHLIWIGPGAAATADAVSDFLRRILGGGMPDRIFSFGTLQLESVQLALFGRLVPTTPDTIRGYRVGEVRITDPAVLAASGADVHPALVATGSDDDEVPGVVLEVSAEELAAADEYERVAYRREALPLGSGGTAWTYLLKHAVS